MFAPVWFAVAVLTAMAGFSSVGVNGQLTCCLPPSGGVVNKALGAVFTVEIGFRNVGSAQGEWSVNVAFEGEKWTWKGTTQTLTLEPNHKKTLTWNGTVPADAPIGSVVRLVAYYGDSYMPLDWWICAVPAAELTIASSVVR
jgi:hypothetical protein